MARHGGNGRPLVTLINKKDWVQLTRDRWVNVGALRGHVQEGSLPHILDIMREQAREQERRRLASPDTILAALWRFQESRPEGPASKEIACAAVFAELSGTPLRRILAAYARLPKSLKGPRSGRPKKSSTP
jgi:hypothetical protein